MSDGESTTPAPRQRPSYGLPGPSSPAPGADTGATGQVPSGHGAPGYGRPGYGTPDYGTQGYGTPGYGAPGETWGTDPYQPQTGPLPATGRQSPAPGRRRGLWPLIIGLVLLLVVAPVATIGGIIWSMSSLVGDAASGPTTMEGGSTSIEVAANEMLIVYVPAADADAAQCTAEGTTPNAVSTVPSSGSVTFADGAEYVQVLGVASLDDTTLTVSCTGTEAPAYLGPYSLLGMAAPLLIGPIIGVVSGLIGLVLTIVGIVLLARSRRT